MDHTAINHAQWLFILAVDVIQYLSISKNDLLQINIKRCVVKRFMHGKKKPYSQVHPTKKSLKYRYTGRWHCSSFDRFWPVTFYLPYMSVTEIRWIYTLYCSLSNETSPDSNNLAVLEIVTKYWTHPILETFLGAKYTLNTFFCSRFPLAKPNDLIFSIWFWFD